LFRVSRSQTINDRQGEEQITVIWLEVEKEGERMRQQESICWSQNPIESEVKETRKKAVTRKKRRNTENIVYGMR
jgi:methyl coenzyme M reductase subunit D